MLEPPVAAAQIGFQPPDKEWRRVVKGLVTKLALNLYLIDLRENRGLRRRRKCRSRELPGTVTCTSSSRRCESSATT